MFFDRDGVLNCAVVRDGKPYPPSSLMEVKILPETLDALQKLAYRGYLMLGITNQPDVARGTQTRAVVEKINELVLSRLPIREIFTCFHDNADACDCHKPKPGLIFQAAKNYGVDLSLSWMVGDRWKDIAAGKSAGVRTVFIDYHYGEAFQGDPADFVVEGIAQVAQVILKG